MSDIILNSLNEAQKEAAIHIDGPLLILAGAGSGKTKTITTRLAYLISVVGIDPSSILTLTFTNKAAAEMRERAFKLIKNVTYPPLLCTFHKFGLLFLKFNIAKIGRKNNFVIIDTDDKKKILRGMDKSSTISPTTVAYEISTYKNSLISPNEAKEKAIAQKAEYIYIAKMYEMYENYLVENNLVDFDDLLLITYRLLEQDPILRKETSNKYKYIMVDEYQDTNDLQFKLLEILSSEHNNLCVVGDDDQSIYGWRGASIKNILNFDKIFKNVVVVKLEKNYRSSDTILNHANLLIEHNRDRLGKKLIGTKAKGKSLTLYESNDENTETRKICDDIRILLHNGVDASNIAILFRVNALSRSLEDGLIKNNINYKLIGGMKFYERAEIKDLIAFFRVITNPNDNFSLKRIINKPKKGIGKTTIDKLDVKSNLLGVSIYEIINSFTPDQLVEIVGKKNSRTLKVFCASISDLQEILEKSKIEFVNSFEETFDFKSSFINLIDADDRIANIDEFYGFLKDFFQKDLSLKLDDFLNEISLSSEQDKLDTSAISLMSIHASKGLEYQHLFIIGLEEGFFPLTGDGNDIEEERRLAYVAITRAMDELTLSFVHNRFYKGKRTQLIKSRFLTESGLIKGSLTIEKSVQFRKGDVVKHKIFGMGRIEIVKKAGKEYKLKINFGGCYRDILSNFIEKV